jgi:hypothetical protein
MMDKAFLPAIRARHAWERQLLAWENVVGVGVGLKEKAGRPTSEEAVLIYVLRKIGLMELPPQHILPRGITVMLGAGRSKDVPTDVVETGPIIALIDPKTRMRPAVGGCSVGHHACGCAGTLGGLVTDARGRPLLLSNNHVLALLNDGRKGDRILQPAPYDGGVTNRDTIATLEGYVQLRWGDKEANFVDAAVARIRDRRMVTGGVLGLQKVASELVTADLRMKVCKSGRTTGLTRGGEVTDVDATFVVGYGAKGRALFRNQVVIRSPKRFSDHGDSGSFILTEDDPPRVTGLLFAGNPQGTVTLANHMETVLEELGVRMAGGDRGAI